MTELKYKKYKCPNCNSIWTAFQLWCSEGSCLTDPEECGWEDALEEIIVQSEEESKKSRGD